MKRWPVLFLLLSVNAFALEAVVTVLETPMLKDKSYDAPVVQYLRKGDVIKIHPSINNDRSLDQYAPSPEKLAATRNKIEMTPEFRQDPLFKGNEANTFYIEDEFIPTLDRQGNTVYVLSAHLYVYFEDSREFNQGHFIKDPTDYRLEEPLPKNYPLKTASGYRGQFIFGLTQPSVESYPYADKVKTKGYTAPKDLNITLMRQAPGEYQDRLFLGATLNLKTFENSYTFEGRRFSTEESLKVGIGPTISYDAYKGEKNRINLSGNIIVNFLDRLSITQSLDKTTKDTRLYTGYSLAPRLALQYHRKQILTDLDLVLGTAMEIGTATKYQAQNGGSQAGWWRNLGDDKFTTRTTFSLGAYVGIQSAY